MWPIIHTMSVIIGCQLSSCKFNSCYLNNNHQHIHFKIKEVEGEVKPQSQESMSGLFCSSPVGSVFVDFHGQPLEIRRPLPSNCKLLFFKLFDTGRRNVLMSYPQMNCCNLDKCYGISLVITVMGVRATTDIRSVSFLRCLMTHYEKQPEDKRKFRQRSPQHSHCFKPSESKYLLHSITGGVCSQ